MKARNQFYLDNDVPKRLRWIRTTLGLSMLEVSEEIPVSIGSLHSIETKFRTPYYELLERMANFYTKLWSEKFIHRFPIYEGNKIEEITFSFITLGQDFPRIKFKSDLEEQKKESIRRELALTERVWELEKQLKEKNG